MKLLKTMIPSQRGQSQQFGSLAKSRSRARQQLRPWISLDLLLPPAIRIGLLRKGTKTLLQLEMKYSVLYQCENSKVLSVVPGGGRHSWPAGSRWGAGMHSRSRSFSRVPASKRASRGHGVVWSVMFPLQWLRATDTDKIFRSNGCGISLLGGGDTARHCRVGLEWWRVRRHSAAALGNTQN